MKHRIPVALLSLAALSPFVADAKSDEFSEQREVVEKEMTRAREELRIATDKFRKLGMQGVHYFSYQGRGRLGLLIDRDESSKASKDGLHVQAVTPGGPADKAGIKAGDVLTAINGKSLALKEARDGKDGYNVLLAETRRPKKGEKVTLDYRRGSSTGRAEVALESSEDSLRNYKLKIFSHLGGLPDSWSDLELVSLNPDLGQYFGTTEGILVVRAPEKSDLPLKAGDVIQKIDDRKPTSPTQAIRILGSYNAGDTVKLEIIRQRRSETVTTKVPSENSEKM